MFSEITNDPQASANLALLILFVVTLLFAAAAISLARQLGRAESENEYLTAKNAGLMARESEWLALSQQQAADIHALESELETSRMARLDGEDEEFELYGTPSPEKAASNGALTGLGGADY